MLAGHTISRGVKWTRKIKKFVHDFREETHLNSDHLYNRRIQEENNLINEPSSTC